MSVSGEKSYEELSEEIEHLSKRFKDDEKTLVKVQQDVTLHHNVQSLHDDNLDEGQKEEESFIIAALDSVVAELKEAEQIYGKTAQRAHNMNVEIERVNKDSAIFAVEHGQVKKELISVAEDDKVVKEELKDYHLKIKALKKGRKTAFNQRQKEHFVSLKKVKADVAIKFSECHKLSAKVKGLVSELAELDKLLMDLVEVETNVTSSNAEMVNKMDQLDSQTELDWVIIEHRMRENHECEEEMQEADVRHRVLSPSEILLDDFSLNLFQKYIANDEYDTELFGWEVNAVMCGMWNDVPLAVEQDELNSVSAAVDENIQVLNATETKHQEFLAAYACNIGNMQNQEHRLSVAREQLAEMEAIGEKQQEELLQLLSNIYLRKHNVEDIDVALNAVRRDCNEAENVIRSVAEEIQFMEAKEKTLADESNEIAGAKAKIQAKSKSVAAERRAIAAELADMDMEGLEKQLTEARERIQEFQRQSQLKKRATMKKLADLRNEKREVLAMLAALEARSARGAEGYRSKMSLLGDLTKQKRRKLDESEKEIDLAMEEVMKIREENERLMQKRQDVRADREVTFRKVKALMKGKGKAKENHSVGGFKKLTGIPHQ